MGWSSTASGHAAQPELAHHLRDCLARDGLPVGTQISQDLRRSRHLVGVGFTRLADRLETAGYLQREPCPTDRRAKFAAITPTGRSVAEQAAQVHLRGLQTYVLDRLSDAEVATLRARGPSRPRRAATPQSLTPAIPADGSARA